MYDPNNPITPPDGGFAITSVPPGGRPSPPSPGMMPPTQAPRAPNPNKGSGDFLNGGGITPGGMPPAPGAPSLPGATAAPLPGMDNRGGFEMSNLSRDQRMQYRDARQAYIDQFKNSIFQWLASRPQDPAQQQTWLAQRPQIDMASFRQSMFNPAPAPAPAPAAITAPTGTTPVDPTRPPPIY